MTGNGKFFRRIQKKLTENGHKELLQTIFILLEPNAEARILDIACEDGSKNITIAEMLRKNHENVFGLDIIDSKVQSAK